MFIDVIGTLFTILLVSPRYWWIVSIVSVLDVLFSIILTVVLSVNVTEIVAGGIFTTINMTEPKVIYQLIPSIFFFLIGLSLIEPRRLRWIDTVNPLSEFKKPWPVIMIKTSIFKILILLFFIWK